MKKLILLTILLAGGRAASAQDYVLKNWIDYFTIMKSGHGITIQGDDLKDSQGAYFLKGVPDGFLQKNTNYWTMTGHFLVPFNDYTGKISTDSTFEYDPNYHALKVSNIYTNRILGTNFDVQVNATFGNIGFYSDGTGTSQEAAIIFDDHTRAMSLKYYPSAIGPGLYLNFADQGSGGEKRVIVGDANGNIVMTNKIITADGKDICKTPNGSWKYIHVADDGSRLVDDATVSIDAAGTATVTIP
ncbi:hypothetical protein [Mucilaginibacter ginsenosidivorans]|uniref:Uncharacterized protein n=1 Tax=Mucilaginibacter ginsenosidivorans TaxID=398053 RepID=A0A5B8UVT3_9SPHI|nr:hypothetical protein [Mucilaginibacter ginsenosidivorans]QEC62546.1 hypothetical protein FRZ54_08065 [Mucilaginibacter ginsenosidivorans]